MSTTTDRMTDCTQAMIRLKKAAILCDGQAAAVTQHLTFGSNVEGLLQAADAYAEAFRRLGNDLADTHTQILTEPHRD